MSSSSTTWTFPATPDAFQAEATDNSGQLYDRLQRLIALYTQRATDLRTRAEQTAREHLAATETIDENRITMQELEDQVRGYEAGTEELRTQLRTANITIQNLNRLAALGQPAPIEPLPRLSEKLPNPPVFSGENKEEYESFVDKLRLKLTGNHDRYPTDQNKVDYAVSRLEGKAHDLIRPHLQGGRVTFATLDALVAHLDAAYSDPNKAITATQHLQKLRQGKRSFSEYYAEFSK